MDAIEPAQHRAVPPPFGYHEPTMRSQLGPRLKLLRQHALLFKTSVAKVVGISPRQLTRIETREAMPRLDTVIKFANLFRVSINYLISDSDEPYPLHDPMENFAAGNTRWR